MRQNTLLATVAALSLLGATGMAAAQAPNQGGAAGSQPPAAAKPEASPAAKEPAAKQPAQTQAQEKPGQGAKPSPQQAQEKPDQGAKPSPQQAQDKQKPGAGPADTKASTSGSAASGARAAAPPPEKRSQIATAIKQEKITEARDVNFNISIGARVPSTVHFYPIPTRIIEIYPEWSGYQVILVNGRYVIVRPNTYEIVYIIEG